MRDINRIEPIMKMISAIWKEFPDMRFFQFIEFIKHFIPTEVGFFYYEDDDLKKRLYTICKSTRGAYKATVKAKKEFERQCAGEKMKHPITHKCIIKKKKKGV